MAPPDETLAEPIGVGLRSIDVRRVLAVLAFLGSLGLIAAGWSSRSGSNAPAPPPPRLKLDPNTAPPEILTALPGIGPGLVKHWVEEREKRPFRSLDDLERRVRGIGPATLARIAPYLEIAKPVPERGSE